MPKLTVTGPDGKSRDFEIEREMTLGRHEINEIQIPEEKASRRHCRFRPDGDKIYVEDLESSNGTKVNGRKITTYVLRDGDAITIGAHTIVFKDERQAPDRTMVLPDINKQAAAVLAAVEAPPPLKKEKEKEPPAAPKKKDTPPRPIPVRDLKPSATESQLSEATAAKTSSLLTVGIGIVGVVLVAMVVIILSHSKQPPAPPPAVAQPQPTPPLTQVVETLPVQTPKKNVPAPIPTPVIETPVVKTVPLDPKLLDALKAAAAERDKAIASANYAGARAPINAFLAAHPNGEIAERAKKELQDTENLIEAALDVSLKEAQRAADQKKFRLVTQHCTRLISSDPNGKIGNQARAILTGIDAASEKRFNELNAKIQESIKAGQLDAAGDTLDKALDELGGTKWSQAISTQQLQVLMARALLKQIEAERAKRTAAGKIPTLNLSAKKISGQFTKVNGTTLELKSGATTLAVPLKDMAVADVESLLQQFNLQDKNLELAQLWILLGRSADAQAEIEKALQNPQQTGSAIQLVNMLPNQKNLKIYDFSHWQHQTEWEAVSGSWSTQNDRYVLDSPDGGETSLKSAAIGPSLSAKGARISFDFELIKPSNGYFFAFELGDDNQHVVSATFSATGLSLHANVSGAVTESDVWLPAPSHVDISCSGNTFSVSVNGKKAKPLNVEGLSELRGTITFRIRESACAIDNVILRNVE